MMIYDSQSCLWASALADTVADTSFLCAVSRLVIADIHYLDILAQLKKKKKD